MKSSLIEGYQQRITAFSADHKEAKRKQNVLAIARLVVFAGGIAAFYYLFSISTVAAAIVTTISIGLFLFLVKRYEEVKYNVDLLEQLIAINEAEIKAQNGDYAIFNSGAAFIDQHHPFSYDLDLFGDRSIFQYLNRTCTWIGRERLGSAFRNVELNREELLKKQSAVRNLSEKIDFCQNFRATGSFFEESAQAKEGVLTWLSKPNFFIGKVHYKAAVIVVPLLSMILILGALFSFIALKYLLAYLLIPVGIAYVVHKKVAKQHHGLSDNHKLLTKYVGLLKLIEREKFEDQYLLKASARLENKSDKASNYFNELSKISNALDSGHNLIGAILARVFLRDLYNVIELEKWKSNYCNQVQEWFDVIAEFDTLSSLGGFAYNHPDFIYPTPVSGKLYAVDTGHPLIAQNERVNNSFSIPSEPQLGIITGANMAGKSTFLRTVGVNLVLAMMGSPVCARQFDFTPVQLFTSMRSKDSLADHSSYFHAELSRLKTMFDQLERGTPLLVLLDELLKGTNSNDQHEGAKAIIEKLLRYKVTGFVATHDLELGKLEEKHPGKVFNKCFEIDFVDDQMIFDYKLKDGISQNMNASFLMRQMGMSSE